MDFKAYLASYDEVSDGDDNDDHSQENGEDGENKKKSLREKYRSLLLESGNPSEEREDKDDKDMEITFNTGLEELGKRILEKSKKIILRRQLGRLICKKEVKREKQGNNLQTNHPKMKPVLIERMPMTKKKIISRRFLFR